ncbi:protein APCDD1-like isoform X2 [Tachypleus tridentatus]|uniref:protein APCDD1-like isoform X2 n=1 Tax=Tachypleus tridentatus TaxID=6853 RepID=UPI003FD06CBD
MFRTGMKNSTLTILIALCYSEGQMTRNLRHHLIQKTDDDRNRCDHWQRLVTLSQKMVSAPLPPNVIGEWVSEGCEIRPGPEYLLRNYQFTKSRFHLLQYYYLDDMCTVPAFSVSAWGRYFFRRPSMVVPGGMDVDYVLQGVDIMAYESGVMDSLRQKINRSCPGYLKSRWRTYKKFRLYSYRDTKEQSDKHGKKHIDCLSGLHLTFNELQLMRVEYRKNLHRGHHQHKKSIELFLGDIHTQVRKRAYYRPNSYQPPLSKQRHHQCHVCHLVSKSERSSPPRLPSRAKFPVFMAGEWISMKCEIRPFGLFLLRKMKFFNFNQSWYGEYLYFRDAKCQVAMYTLIAEGEYRPGRPSHHHRGSTNYDFIVEKALIKPLDQLFVDNLNGHDSGMCGHKGFWRLNVSQDVTFSGGCSGIGLVVPNTEYDIVRTGIDHHGRPQLYLGDTDTDVIPSTPDKRPTSYQPALTQCRSFTEHIGTNYLYPLPRVHYNVINRAVSNTLKESYFLIILLVLLSCDNNVVVTFNS